MPLLKLKPVQNSAATFKYSVIEKEVLGSYRGPEEPGS